MPKYIMTSIRSRFMDGNTIGNQVREVNGVKFSDSIPEATEHLLSEYKRMRISSFDPLMFMVKPENYVITTVEDDGTVISMVRLDHYLENGGSIGDKNG